jgi:hypothetical protein
MTTPQFTEEDLHEIYRALQTKLRDPVTQGNDACARGWRRHLREIMEKIEETGIRL